MVLFSYRAKEGPAKIVDGTIEATNVDQAIRKIIQSGLAPLDVSEALAKEMAPARKKFSPRLTLSRRISSNDLVLFTRQMTDLIDASIPILRCLEIVMQQTHHPQLKDVVKEIYNNVKDGAAFSDSLAKYPKLFSTLYVNMVRTGEVSGKLQVVMNRLAQHQENEQEVQAKVRQSLAYPALICVVGFITIFVLLSFVVPRLTVMFDDFEQTLPVATVFLMAVSYFLSRFWWAIVLLFIAVGIYFKRWLETPTGRVKFDLFQLKIPLYSDFIKIVETGRLSRTLGTLLESGVVITTALNSVWATIINTAMRDEMKQVAEEVKSGASLKSALKRCTFIPEMAINMIAVGEETGHLERGLYKVAETYERQSDRLVKTMVSLLGPIVLVVIVVIVGFVVISMILPILQMNTLIS